MKDCPFCAQQIAAAALVCRYCGHGLPDHEADLRQLRGPTTARLKWPLGIASAISLLASALIVTTTQLDSVSLTNASFSSVVENVALIGILLVFYFMLIFTPLGSLAYGIALLRNGEPVYRAIGLFVFLFLLFFASLVVLIYLSPDALGSQYL